MMNIEQIIRVMHDAGITDKDFDSIEDISNEAKTIADEAIKKAFANQGITCKTSRIY